MFGEVYETLMANDSTRCRAFRAERQFLTVPKLANGSSKSHKKTANITHA